MRKILAGVYLLCAVVLVSIALAGSGLNPVALIQKTAAQQVSAQEFPLALKYVPLDAALFIHLDISQLWWHPILQSIQRADSAFFSDLIALAKSEFGSGPGDLRSIVAFVPKFKDLRDLDHFAVIATFREDFNEGSILKGCEKLLPKNSKLRVETLDKHTAFILVGLGDEYSKSKAEGKGPLNLALKEAASGMHAVVVGGTFASWPDDLRGDDLPPPVRPLQPIFKSQAFCAQLDLGKSLALELTIQAGTAARAAECAKALGAGLELFEMGLTDIAKDFDPPAAKHPGSKDVAALLKATHASAKDAKIAVRGSDVGLSASLATDLPFASAFLAAKQHAQDAAARSQCINNMKQIGLALHNYHAQYNTFPPAAVCDKKGNRLLSWRVLLLPYLEQQKLFDQFKLDESWDSAHNKKLLAKMPSFYAMPGTSKPGDSETFFRVFVGNGAGFDWVSGTSILSIRDGTSNTIMFATAATSVPWTKPDELEFDPEKDMTKLVGPGGKFLATFFDGSSQSFNKVPKKETLKALITRDGGEVIQYDDDK